MRHLLDSVCHRVLLAALVVAAKMTHDRPLKNNVWARYSQVFVTHDVNLMELQFLRLIDYRTVVTEVDLVATCFPLFPDQEPGRNVSMMPHTTSSPALLTKPLATVNSPTKSSDSSLPSSLLPFTSSHRSQSETDLRAKAQHDPASAHVRTLAQRKLQRTPAAIDEQEHSTIPVTSFQRHGSPPLNGFDHDSAIVPAIVADNLQNSSCCSVFSSDTSSISSCSGSRLTMIQELAQSSSFSTDFTQPITPLSPTPSFWDAYKERTSGDTANTSLGSHGTLSVMERFPPITPLKLHHHRAGVPATNEAKPEVPTSVTPTTASTAPHGICTPWLEGSTINEPTSAVSTPSTIEDATSMISHSSPGNVRFSEQTSHRITIHSMDLDGMEDPPTRSTPVLGQSVPQASPLIHLEQTWTGMQPELGNGLFPSPTSAMRVPATDHGPRSLFGRTLKPAKSMPHMGSLYAVSSYSVDNPAPPLPSLPRKPVQLSPFSSHVLLPATHSSTRPPRIKRKPAPLLNLIRTVASSATASDPPDPDMFPVSAPAHVQHYDSLPNQPITASLSIHTQGPAQVSRKGGPTNYGRFGLRSRASETSLRATARLKSFMMGNLSTR